MDDKKWVKCFICEGEKWNEKEKEKKWEERQS